MKIETRPTIKDYYICEYCDSEYSSMSEAEMCEVECKRKQIIKNCKHGFKYDFKTTGIDEVQFIKQCTCGYAETIDVDLGILSDTSDHNFKMRIYELIESGVNFSGIYNEKQHNK